jgi:hypothetical protein
VEIAEHLGDMDTDLRIKLRIGYEQLDWISLAEGEVQ